ncbi:hypothetical protein [Streptomyces sp. SA15]|uniref:hypothetical protein n=1 Tax=Streptomyces sp. SA15 TaxID=934019 RepID=UPI00117D7DC0|nr:hypothetical protein [Streptomyces sp. SA15]
MQETTSVLPDGKAIPGWDVAAEPSAYAQKKALEFGLTSCYTKESCDNVHIAGRSMFMKAQKPGITFSIMTYQDAETAQSAYDPVWEAWNDRVPDAKRVDLGKIGERNDAVTGMDISGVPGSKSVLSQVRVGSVILLTHGAAVPKVELSDSLIGKCATAFAERARQAQDGETPSAGLENV